jgi:Fur family transcriptional regulator, ferric uptake regulator
MKNYSRYAIGALKKAGYKITQQRQTIIKLLAKTDKALSPYDMREALKKQKYEADVVTIYRILETLEKLSLVHKVLAVNGYIRCNTEKPDDKNPKCHHYLLCKKCHKIEEVEGEDISKLEQKIENEKKFHINSHYLEFIGICDNCSFKQKND